MLVRTLLFAFICSSFIGPLKEPDGSTTFRDNSIHYSFSYPADYKNRSVSSRRPAGDFPSRAAELSERITDCLAIPVAAVRPTDGGLFDMVMIMDVDLKCANESLSKNGLVLFANGIASKILTQHGTSEVGPVKTFKLAGHDAVYMTESVDESAKKPGRSLGGGLVCTLVENHAVCWQMLSYHPETLQGLLALPVSFDGQPAEPLLPAR